MCYYFNIIKVAEINPRICTHLIFSFFGLDANGNISYFQRTETEVATILNDMNGLKRQNPSLKVMAAIGGWNESLNPAWFEMAENLERRKAFADNTKRITDKFNLDGIGP